MPSPSRILYLIDASSYVYRAFHALPPLTGANGMPTNAIYGFTTMLLKLLRDTAPEYLAAVFDAPGRTFRDDLYSDYKANRTAMPAELQVQLPYLHDVVSAFAIPTLSVPGVEADDVIATVAEQMAPADLHIVIITADKDL